MIEPNEFDRILGAIRSWGIRSEARGRAEQRDAAPAGSWPPGSPTILLVDDDDETRLTVLEVLGAAGYTVLEARDGNEALMVIDWYDGPIDLVITDVVMPYVDGKELAQRLQPLRHGTCCRRSGVPWRPRGPRYSGIRERAASRGSSIRAAGSVGFGPDAFLSVPVRIDIPSASPSC